MDLILTKVTKISADKKNLYRDSEGRVPLHYVDNSKMCSKLIFLNPIATTALDVHGDTPLSLFYTMCQNLYDSHIRKAYELDFPDEFAITVENEGRGDLDLMYEPMTCSEIRNILLLFLKEDREGELEPYEILKELLTNSKCILFLFRLLLKYFGDESVYTIDPDGNTLLHLAVSCMQYTDDELILCNYCISQLNDCRYVVEDKNKQQDICQDCFDIIGYSSDKETHYTENYIYGKVPGAVETLISINPTAACIPTPSCKTPLHSAAETGRPFHEGTELILKAAPQALYSRPLDSFMYPFMLAATSHFASHDSLARHWERICTRSAPEIMERRLRAFQLSYELLIECPVVVANHLEKLLVKKKHKRVLSFDEYDSFRYVRQALESISQFDEL